MTTPPPIDAASQPLALPPVVVRRMAPPDTARPWFAPTTTVGAWDPSVTAGWADIDRLVLLRALAGRDGRVDDNGTVKEAAMQFLVSHWESLRMAQQRVGPERLSLQDADGVDLLSLPWHQLHEYQRQYIRIAFMRTGGAGFRVLALAARLEGEPGAPRAARARCVPGVPKDGVWLRPGIIEVLERDQFPEGHWIWRNTAVRKLWTRAALEILLGATVEKPWSLNDLAVGRGVLDADIVWLNAALLGSTGDGHLGVHAARLAGSAGVREVLEATLQQVRFQTRSAPWAQRMVRGFEQLPEFQTEAELEQWPTSLQREALLATSKPFREIGLRSMAARDAAATARETTTPTPSLSPLAAPPISEPPVTARRRSPRRA